MSAASRLKERETLAPREALCDRPCGARIVYVSLSGDHATKIPVDPGSDPTGALVVEHYGVKRTGLFTVRFAVADDPPDHLRRRIHWSTCTSTSRWLALKRTSGFIRLTTPLGADRPSPGRAGLCAHCRRLHGWHYGGPVASPVCDRCKLEGCAAEHPGRSEDSRSLCQDCRAHGRYLTGEPF